MASGALARGASLVWVQAANTMRKSGFIGYRKGMPLIPGMRGGMGKGPAEGGEAWGAGGGGKRLDLVEVITIERGIDMTQHKLLQPWAAFDRRVEVRERVPAIVQEPRDAH